MSDPHETPAIDALLKEHESLWKASQLLEEIYSLVGPYGRLPADGFSSADPDLLWSKVRDHFGFDDSE